MSESTHQARRIRQLEAEGYYVIKLIQTNKNGIPDLLALKPTGEIYFEEVKGVKGKASKLQEYRIQELKNLGFKVEINYEQPRK